MGSTLVRSSITDLLYQHSAMSLDIAVLQKDPVTIQKILEITQNQTKPKSSGELIPFVPPFCAPSALRLCTAPPQMDSLCSERIQQLKDLKGKPLLEKGTKSDRRKPAGGRLARARDGQNWPSPAVTVTHAQGKTETQPLREATSGSHWGGLFLP